MTLQRLPSLIFSVLAIMLATLSHAQIDSTGKTTGQDCYQVNCGGHIMNYSFEFDNGIPNCGYIDELNICQWRPYCGIPVLFQPGCSTTLTEGSYSYIPNAPFSAGGGVSVSVPDDPANNTKFVGLHGGYDGGGHWDIDGIYQDIANNVTAGAIELTVGKKYYFSFWARNIQTSGWPLRENPIAFYTVDDNLALSIPLDANGKIQSGWKNILSNVHPAAQNNYHSNGRYFIVPADTNWHHYSFIFTFTGSSPTTTARDFLVAIPSYLPYDSTGTAYPAPYRSMVAIDKIDLRDSIPVPYMTQDTSVCSGSYVTITVVDTTNMFDTLNYRYVDGSGVHYGGAEFGFNYLATFTIGPITTTTTVYLDSVNIVTNGCSYPMGDSMVINVYPQPNITISGSDTICNGGNYNIPLSGTYTAGVTQVYYTLLPTTSMTVTATTSGINTGPLGPGTYVFRLDSAKSGYCSGTASGTFTLTVLPSPTASISANACIGNPITVTGTPNTYVVYQQLPGTSTTTVLLDNGGNGTIANPGTPGVYTYVITEVYFAGAHPCTDTLADTVSVNILPIPTATLTPDGHQDYCYVAPTVHIFGDAAYANILVDGAGSTVILPWAHNFPPNTGVTPITHTVVLQQGLNAGCSLDIYDTLFITIWPTPTATMHGIDTTICNGDSAIVQIDGVQGSYAYYTVDGVQDTIYLPPPDGVANIIVPGVNLTGVPITHTYILTGSGYDHAPYCYTADYNVVNITINPTPTVTITEAPSICVMPGDSLHANGADSYVWSPSTGLSCPTCATTAVSVTATTVYTVTGTNGYGCSSTATVTAAVIPTITVTNIGTPPYNSDTICIGNSVQLEADGAVSYTWNPSSVICAINCATVTAMPSSTTTYTVTGTDINGCIDSTTITITVDTLPVLDTFMLSGPQSVCYGSSTSVYFVGTPNCIVSGNINGNPATFPLDPTGYYTLTVTPTVTTTINVTSIAYPYFPYCSQPANGNIEIDVLPVATVNFSPNAATFCPGQNSDGLNSYPLTPNVTNVFTFNWTSTPFDPTLNPTTLYPTVTPTVTTTYYLTVWANDTCPPATDSFKLVVPTEQCVCSIFCGAIPQPLGAFGVIDADVPPGNYYIPNNAVVKGGVIHFDQAIVDIANNVTVTVDSASVLELRSSHLFDCDSMWNGIVLHTSNDPGVPTTGHVVFTKGNLVEDADTAVFTDGAYKLPIFNSTAPPSIEQYVIYSDDAIFNSNLYGIGIQNIHDSGSAFYPFLIRNTVFTSRKMNVGSVGPNCTDNYPYYWPPTMGTGGLKNNWTAPTPYDPPYSIDDPNGSVIGSAFNLQVCHNGSFPYAGIMLRDIGWHHSNNYYGVWIGDENINQYGPGNPTENLFDHVSSGISAYNANFLLHNAAYIHMYQTLPSTMGIVTGNGVYAINTDGGKHSMEMDGIISSFMPNLANRFYDCISGVYSLEYYRTKMWYAEMYSPQQVGVPTPNGTGRFGFYGQSSLYRRVDLQKNIINNVTDGIVFISTYASGTNSTINTYAGVVDISDNDVSANMSGAPITPTRFMQQAIYVANGVNQTTPIINTTKINNNSIRDVYNGIYVANFLPTVVTDSNSVSLVLDPSGNSQRGIEHAKCSGDYISSNGVTGPGANTPAVSSSSYAGQIISGIYGTNNTSFVVGCNTVSSLNSGFEFFDNYNSGKWIKNEMGYNLFDYVLNNAVIGPQLGSGNVCSNYWDPAGTSTYNTLVKAATIPSTSVLYLGGTAGSGFVPISNIAIPVSSAYSPFSSPATLVATATLPSSLDCDTTEEYPAGFELLFRAARRHVGYDGQYSKRSSWMAQQALYEQIHADTTLADSSTVLQQFKTMATNSRYHYLHCIEDKLTQGDYIGASTMLNAPIDTMATTDSDIVTGVTMADDTAADVVVAHYKLFYSLYLKYKLHTMNGNDSSQLLALANMCPPIDGAVVYQARVLYALTTHDFHMFSDNGCDSSKTDSVHHNEARQASTVTTVLADVDGQQYSLYPNPSRGDVYVQQQVADEAPVNAIVLNDAGQIMYKGTMSFKDKKEHLHYDNLLTGLYLMQLTDSKGRVFTLKFTVEK